MTGNFRTAVSLTRISLVVVLLGATTRNHVFSATALIKLTKQFEVREKRLGIKATNASMRKFR